MTTGGVFLYLLTINGYLVSSFRLIIAWFHWQGHSDVDQFDLFRSIQFLCSCFSLYLVDNLKVFSKPAYIFVSFTLIRFQKVLLSLFLLAFFLTLRTLHPKFIQFPFLADNQAQLDIRQKLIVSHKLTTVHLGYSKFLRDPFPINSKTCFIYLSTI